MEILVNTNPPVKHRIYWKGQTVAADSAPIVKIYDVTEDPTLEDPTTSVFLVELEAEEVETDFGVYQVFIPLLYASRTRQLQLLWEYYIEGSFVQKRHNLFVVQPYIDLTQAVDELGIGSDPSDPNYKSYAELQDAEGYARRIIEAYTGQRFYEYFDSHTGYGDGTDVLPMPFRITELKELYSNDIKLIDVALGIQDFGYDVQISESRFALRINRANLIDNTVYTANGFVPPTINDGSGGGFSRGIAYKVEANFGWERVPDEVEIACLELMKDYFSRDKIWRNKYLHSVQSFDWHFEYNTGAFIGTGNLYVDQLLLPYVLTQMVLI